MIRRPPRSTRTDTSFPTRRSSDLEEIFGPVLSVTPFKTNEDAISIANDTIYGLGAGVWTRNGNHAYRLGRAIEAGRVWTNCYHAYPAHAALDRKSTRLNSSH